MIPAKILSYNDNEPLQINLSFLGLDVLGVHMKKSNEWLYGIYRENKLLGFLYEGTGMSKEDQALYGRRLIPEKLDSLNYFKRTYEGKVGYYKSLAEAYSFVGFLNDQNIISKI